MGVDGMGLISVGCVWGGEGLPWARTGIAIRVRNRVMRYRFITYFNKGPITSSYR